MCSLDGTRVLLSLTYFPGDCSSLLLSLSCIGFGDVKRRLPEGAGI